MVAITTIVLMLMVVLTTFGQCTQLNYKFRDTHQGSLHVRSNANVQVIIDENRGYVTIVENMTDITKFSNFRIKSRIFSDSTGTVWMLSVIDKSDPQPQLYVYLSLEKKNNSLLYMRGIVTIEFDNDDSRSFVLPKWDTGRPESKIEPDQAPLITVCE